MNRAIQKLHQRRCALKNNVRGGSRGGGLAVNPGAAFLSENGVPYAENQHYSDCYSQGRPGALEVHGNPELAQTPMAGGYTVLNAAQLMALSGKRGGTRQGCGLMRGAGCGCNWKLRGGQCGLMKGGQCGQPQRAWLGGKRTRRQRGGNKGGFEMAVAQNIGGTGPIAEPVRIPVPCDARAGMQNPFTATPVNPDPRAAMGYSLTPNRIAAQTGGQLSERVPNYEYAQTGAGYGNAYDAACYKAPGSEMPVYPATSAGFHFTPSTQAGATLPDGVTAFNEVVAHTARLGGGRKSRKTKSSKTKGSKSRKGKRTYRKKRASRKH